MKLARSLILGTLAWVLVVAVGSTLVWTVISRAGQEVVAPTEPMIVAGRTLERSASPSRSRSASPSESASPSPSQPPSTSVPASTPPAVPPAAPASSPSSSASDPDPDTAAPVAQRRTWQGEGGLVVAQCRGATMSLVAAQPDAGYAVDVGERGPETLEVEFDGRGDNSGKRTRVEARCMAGVPQFNASSDESDESDEH